MKRSPLTRSRGLRMRSPKRAALYRRERVPLVVEMLEAFPTCQRCMQARSVDVHEVQSRGRGGSIVDRSNLRCVCRPCHDFITSHPLKAVAEGWLKHSWDAA